MIDNILDELRAKSVAGVGDRHVTLADAQAAVRAAAALPSGTEKGLRSERDRMPDNFQQAGAIGRSFLDQKAALDTMVAHATDQIQNSENLMLQMTAMVMAVTNCGKILGLNKTVALLFRHYADELNAEPGGDGLVLGDWLGMDLTSKAAVMMDLLPQAGDLAAAALPHGDEAGIEGLGKAVVGALSYASRAIPSEMALRRLDLIGKAMDSAITEFRNLITDSKES